MRAPIGNGIDLKLGTWDTIIGYEVANAGGNPNYTRSYGYSVEPTQHTGLLGSYQVNKVVRPERRHRQYLGPGHQ